MPKLQLLLKELKNKLGIAVQESEEEEEEEVDNSPHFMSRYYLRASTSAFVGLVCDVSSRQSIKAKNSGKPRWMLLSEDIQRAATYALLRYFCRTCRLFLVDVPMTHHETSARSGVNRARVMAISV